MTGLSYILLVNIYITLFYTLYSLFLRKETFFQLNRIYLIGCLAASFIIPFIQNWWIDGLTITDRVKYLVYASPFTIYAQPGAANNQFNFTHLLTWLYFAGVVIFSTRLLVKLRAVKKLINEPNNIGSFSFFNKISLADNVVENDAVNDHEYIHASQWHSADIMLMEIVIIINWFNPLLYLYRKALKIVHEFIADEGALKQGADKSAYAMLLLSQTFEKPINNLVNPFFNQSLLKQRIMMIKKNKSNRMALLKYVLSAPLFILMLILSSATVNRSLNRNDITDNAISYQQDDKQKVYSTVEQEPSFPNGRDKFYEFLAHNIKYPAEMREKKAEGKVIVSFVVETDGSLSYIKILKDAGYGSGKETLRVFALSPKWNPGTQKGQKVRVQYTMPVTFALADKNSKG